MPRVVYSGEGSLEKIVSIVKGNYKRVAVFTDEGVFNAGLLEKPLELIKKAGAEVILFNKLPTEPACWEVQAIVDEFQSVEAEFIIAIGGGSVMDVGKLASVLAGKMYSVKDLLRDSTLARKTIKTLMIPTTAGTGAEATPNSIIAEPKRDLKTGIVNEALIADYVILDAEMIKNLPPNIAAATGVDALSHAIECFTSKKSNPFSNLFALEALKLILCNIEKACDDSGNIKAKSAMLTASFYGGVAIASSGTTAVHALSYPLGGKYHIPHGVSNAMLLLPVMEFNEPVCQEQFSVIYDAVCSRRHVSVEQKSKWVLQRLKEIINHLEIPDNLNGYGVHLEDLDLLVESGMKVQRLLENNKRTITEEDVRNLYLRIIK